MGVKADNRRIAANTILLYIRMMFCMGVSFYSTRVALLALGVVDYGLVNAVGGVVSMFVFMSIPLSTACSRYFSFDLGLEDPGRLKITFSTMIILYLIGALILVGLIESVGYWYMRNKLVLPDERMTAAMIFFHLSVATLVIHWFSIPYSSLIISYENMALYAYLSVFDVLTKLFAACAVLWVRSMDGLILYGVMLLAGTCLCTFANYWFARSKYPACRFHWCFDKSTFKSLCAFNGWSLFGSFSWTSSEIFVNLLLNAFFGPVVNAARGIAAHVMSGVFGFTQNFMTASRPQIVKLWAAGNREEFYSLLKRTSKIGYFLILFVALPLIFELEAVLRVWLKEVPPYAVVFTKIIIVTSLVNTFSHPIVYAAQAVGRIALFEGIGSGVRILVWPASWIALRCGCGPEMVLYIALSATTACVAARFLILARISGIPCRDFTIDVFLRSAIVTGIVFAIVACPFVLMAPSFWRFVIIGFLSSVSMVLIGGCLGFNRQERKIVWGLISSRIENFRRRGR